jgi:hypothetical protein
MAFNSGFKGLSEGLGFSERLILLL